MTITPLNIDMTMKALTKTLTLTALFVLLALPVQAQALLGESNAVAAFEATPVEQVQANQLQDIIFIALNSEQDLSATAPQLLNVVLNHPNENTRMMAVTGLHAVDSETEMFKLIRAVDNETSPEVRATMVRALNNFFDGRYAEDDPRYVHAALLNGQ